jgi:hypothetical protein
VAFTVGEVVTGARAWHPSFDEAVHGDTVAFDWLTSFFRIERRKLQALVPEMFLFQQVLPLPVPVFSDGIPLLSDVESVFSATAIIETETITRGEPVALVPLEHLQDHGPWPALAYVAPPINRVYLRGSEADWLGYVSLLVNYVPLPGTLSALADVVALPDAYLDVAIAGLSVFFAMRSGKERIGPAHWQYFVQREQEVRQAADMALASQRAGEVWRTRELS